jgi:tetratricopeptide (TPR) repeat protein
MDISHLTYKMLVPVLVTNTMCQSFCPMDTNKNTQKSFLMTQENVNSFLMSTRPLIFAFILLVISPCFAESTHFEVGVNALQEEKFQEAQDIFRQLLDQLPDHPTLLFNLGLTHYHLGEVGRALGLWRMARSLGDQSPDIHTAIAIAEDTLGIKDRTPSGLWVLYLWLAEKPLYLWLALGLLLLLGTGMGAIRYGAKQKKPFVEWPLHLQILIPAMFLSLIWAGHLIYRQLETKGTIITQDQLVYARPSDGAPGLNKIREGEWVYIEGQNQDWWQVRSQNGFTGWVPPESLIPFGGRQ